MRKNRNRIAAIAVVAALAGAGSVAAQDLDALLGGADAAPEAREESSPRRSADDPATPATETSASQDAADAPPPPGGEGVATDLDPRSERRRRVIEEVVVTAQKTEQSLRDVPISMSVLDDDFIGEQGISDFRDLALYAPNVSIDNRGRFPDVRMRGFGAPLLNKAFEQPVGLVIDGIPYGVRPYFQGPLFDLDRVEVLRGPQGTLFGKNTTAGLLNVVTKKPTDELTASIDLELGELGRRRIEGAVGGPIVAGLVNFRLSGLSDERDGLVENTTARVAPGAPSRTNGIDRKGVRAQLGFPDLFGGRLVVGYEHVDVDLIGGGFEMRTVPDRVKPFYEAWDPDTDYAPGNHVGSTDHPEGATRKIDTVVANAGWDVVGWGIDGVAGYSLLRVTKAFESDFGPAPAAWTFEEDDNPQWTFELRATSPSLSGFFGLERLFGFGLGSTNFTGGFFFQERRIDDSLLGIVLNVPVVAQFLAFETGGMVGPIDQFIGPAVPFGLFGTLNTEEGEEEVVGFFEQKQDSIAGFGQFDWHVSDRWTIQYGMRLTQEWKDASWERVFTRGTGAAFTLVANQNEFTASRSRSEFAFTPKMSILWDWTDDVGLYAAWAKGFKSGGFNEFAVNDVNPLEYDSERMTAWELGSKSSLLDGTASLNVALFRQEAEDLQVLTILPESLTAQAVNAGKARSQGVEVDGTWLPTDWLTIVATAAFTDSKYVEFPFGSCLPGREDEDGDGDARCDLAGQPLFRTPKWVATIAPTAAFPLASLPGSRSMLPSFLEELELAGGLRVEYQDVHFIHESSDPRTRQPAFFRLGARLGFRNVARGWSASVHVENLTDEDVATLVREFPLGEDNLNHVPDPQQNVYGKIRWSF